jgi:ABC-type multidrug transport system fused ATPase/permease subunit
MVVEHGQIVQRGRYDDLLAEEGAFRRLATTMHGAIAKRP